MRKILFITPNLAFNGAVKQVTLLASGLQRPDFESHVSTLEEGPAADTLRSAGVEVHALGWRRWFDLNPLRRLRQLIDVLRPDVIHTWGLASLRAALVVKRPPAVKLIASIPQRAHKPGMLRDRLLRALLQRADWVVPAAESEAQIYRQLGLPASKLVVIERGVEAPNGSMRGRAEVHQALDLPAEARLMLCAGPLEPGKGYRDAVWAFDILKYVYEDVHLLVIGDGSGRRELEQFVHSIGVEKSVHFLGRQDDLHSLLAHADVVCVPSRADRGCNVALEAMAAARPVVACRTPGLAGIVADGETGFLVAPGDKAGIARQTRVLLEQPQRRRQMGEAGRERVSRHFSAAAMVDRFAELYEEK